MAGHGGPSAAARSTSVDCDSSRIWPFVERRPSRVFAGARRRRISCHCLCDDSRARLSNSGRNTCQVLVRRWARWAGTKRLGHRLTERPPADATLYGCLLAKRVAWAVIGRSSIFWVKGRLVCGGGEGSCAHRVHAGDGLTHRQVGQHPPRREHRPSLRVGPARGARSEYGLGVASISVCPIVGNCL